MLRSRTAVWLFAAALVAIVFNNLYELADAHCRSLPFLAQRSDSAA